MDRQFDIDPDQFQERKRRRISEMNAMAPPPPKVAPTSAPGIHEIATFLPGRLEFEHELDNDAEDLVKDLEFGVCLEYGGDQIVEDADDLDVRARLKWEEEHKQQEDGSPFASGKGPMKGMVNGAVNGYHVNGDIVKQESQTKSEDVVMANGSQEEDGAEEPTQLPPFETKDSLAFKMTLLEMYSQRVDKRIESKALMFNRGLVDYKKVRYFDCSIYSKPHLLQMQAAEKKRPREDREFIQRLRPFARLQTAEDFEIFSTDMLCTASMFDGAHMS
jgi:transcriptional adapter 2-alpha